MILFNLHTHTSFSDGSDKPEKYLEEAIKQKFSILGFSDHSPVPFENTFAIEDGNLHKYFESITAHKNTSEVKVLAGLEMDYIPGITESAEHYRKNYPLDYIIGSVHLVKNPENGKLWFIDGPDISIYDEGLKEVFGGDVRSAITAYYNQLREMIIVEKPEILGHMDKIKMYNRGRYFSEDEQWYKDLVEEVLQTARLAGCVIEINTRGVYKKRSDSFFPGIEILKRIKELDIQVVISSDAHKPSELSIFFDETRQIINEIEIKVKDSGW